VAIVLFAGMALLSLTSCGDNAKGSNRIPLEGKVVTSTRRPVNGSISLTPAPGTNGPAATAAIVEGHYRFNVSNGPGPSKYHATVLLQQTERAASRKDAPQKSQVRESFDADLSSSQPRLDHTLKSE